MQATAKQQEQLDSYKALLIKYHKALDLMSAKGLKDIDARFKEAMHFAKAIQQIDLDVEDLSLENPDVENKSILDIGSGAGLPAIPLAILLPEHKFMLVERRQRRTSFLTIVKSQLKLNNVTVVNDDVQNINKEALQQSQTSIKIVTALWVGDFSLLLDLTDHLVEDRCVFMSKKASDWSLKQEVLPEDMFEAIDFDLSEHPLPLHGKLVILEVNKKRPKSGEEL